METINVHVEIVVTLTPAVEALLRELARAIAKLDRDAATEEMARITRAAESSAKQ